MDNDKEIKAKYTPEERSRAAVAIHAAAWQSTVRRNRRGR